MHFNVVLMILLGAGSVWSATDHPRSRAGTTPNDWAVWHHLERLPLLEPTEAAFLTSSYCRDGCRFDRHSHGAPKFLRTLGEEGVIFEDAGAGVVTRIWMTMGDGISTPLDPDIGIQIHIDHDLVVDMPLADFFSGNQAPFLFPANGNRDVSSGGNYCYTPIAYRNACRISLTNARDKRIWFQVSHQALFESDRIDSFDGSDRFQTWRDHLGQPGSDPWQGLTQPLQGGQSLIQPGGEVQLLDTAGSDTIYALTLQLPQTAWTELHIDIRMDGTLRASMPIADFFAVGSRYETPKRSLFLGFDGSALYCYFPMPFFKSAEITLSDPENLLESSVIVGSQIRSAGIQPPSNAAYFTAIASEAEVPLGKSHNLFDLEARGKWVGMFAEMGGVGTPSMNYLEGDEQIFLDGSAQPQFYGTGVEDFFGGGFYFRDQNQQPQPFRLALHGMSYHHNQNDEGTTAMYRFMVADAVPFNHAAMGIMEAGPTGNIAMRAKTINYFYLRETRPTEIPDPVPSGRSKLSLDSGAGERQKGGLVFQDSALEAFLLSAFWFDSETPVPFDSDGDGSISSLEAQAVTGSVDITGDAITTLEDLSHFPNMGALRIGRTGIATLELDQFPSLTRLVLDQNPNLSSMRLLALPVLTGLELLGNARLVQTDLIDVDALTTVVSDYNPSLDDPFFANSTQLRHLQLRGSPMTTLTFGDLANLTELNLGQMPDLDHLTLDGPLALERLEIAGNDDLTAVNLTGLPELVSLEITGNPLLGNLHLEALAKLDHLKVDRNPSLTSLDLENLPLLRVLTASHNSISTVRIHQSPALEAMQLANNRLENLGFITAFPNLEWLDASANRLLTLPELPLAMTSLFLENNRLVDLGQTTLPGELVFLEAGGNHLLEIDNLVQEPAFLTQPFAYLGLGDNFLNGNDCPAIETLETRSQQSGALFHLLPQHLPYPAWPDITVSDLVQNGFAPLNCGPTL